LGFAVIYNKYENSTQKNLVHVGTVLVLMKRRGLSLVVTGVIVTKYTITPLYILI
jgi:hypothetical protein